MSQPFPRNFTTTRISDYQSHYSSFSRDDLIAEIKTLRDCYDSEVRHWDLVHENKLQNEVETVTLLFENKIEDLTLRLDAAIKLNDYIKDVVVRQKLASLYNLFQISPDPDYEFSKACPFKCPSCRDIFNKDPSLQSYDCIEYCRAECHYCTVAHASSHKSVIRGIDRDVRKLQNRQSSETISPHPSSPSVPSPVHSDRVTGHRYIFVTLTANPSWGDDNYLISQFKLNFQGMMPASTNTVCSCYVIEYTQAGTPHLHGLICQRIPREKGAKTPKVSQSMKIYDPMITIQGTKEKVKSRSTFELLSHYDKSTKTYHTDIGTPSDSIPDYDPTLKTIWSKYNYMKKSGAPIIGDPISSFISPY